MGYYNRKSDIIYWEVCNPVKKGKITQPQGHTHTHTHICTHTQKHKSQRLKNIPKNIGYREADMLYMSLS